MRFPIHHAAALPKRQIHGSHSTVDGELRAIKLQHAPAHFAPMKQGLGDAAEEPAGGIHIMPSTVEAFYPQDIV